MYKVKTQIVPSYVRELFSSRESQYDLRDNDLFNIPNFKTITYGEKSVKYYGAKLWSNIPSDYKQCVSLSSFNLNVTRWLDSIDDMACFEFA